MGGLRLSPDSDFICKQFFAFFPVFLGTILTQYYFPELFTFSQFVVVIRNQVLGHEVSNLINKGLVFLRIFNFFIISEHFQDFIFYLLPFTSFKIFDTRFFV